MPGRSVTCITTGEVYSSISAAERANDIKSGTLSPMIKSKEPVDGKLYAFTDEIEEEPKLEESESVDETSISEETDVTDETAQPESEDAQVEEEVVEEEKVEEEKVEEESVVTDDHRYPAPSLSDMYSFAQGYRLKGVDCEVVDGFIVFFKVWSADRLEEVKSYVIKHPEYKHLIRFTAHDSKRYKDLIRKSK